MTVKPFPDAELDRLVYAAEARFAAAIRKAFAAATERLFRTAKAMTAAGVEEWVSVDDAGVATQIWQQEIPELSATVQAVYTQSGESVAATLVSRAGMSVVPPGAFDVLNQHAADHLAQTRNRLVRFGDAAWGDIRAQLLEGFKAGEGIEPMSRRLRGVSEMSQRRARTVARTEVISASNTGAMTGAMSLPEDVRPATKTWLATRDGRTRPDHVAANRQTVAFTDKFTVGGYRMGFPGEWGAPASEVINCFAGDQLVEWVGQAECLTRRWHPDPLLEITTVDGVSLVVTPNHPLLTRSGWSPAKALNLGDHVLRAVDGAPHVEDLPASIEQVYRAACEVGPQRRIRGRRVDFHGDGADGEIEVVGADGHLLDVLDIGSVQMPRQLDLVGLDVGQVDHAAAGRLYGATLGQVGSLGVNDGSAPSLVSRRRQVASLVGCHAGEADAVGLAASSDGQPGTSKGAGHGSAADAKFAGYGLNADRLVVEPVEIVRVDVRSGGHWVYNLTSSTGLLVCNGILASNCRCTVLFDVDLAPPASIAQADTSPAVDPGSVRTREDLRRVAESHVLPPDDDRFEYFYHATRSSSEIDDIARGGLRPGSGTDQVWLSKDEIRDRGGGYVVVRVPRGVAREGRDVVERNLVYREWTVPEIHDGDVLRAIRVVEDNTGFRIREDRLAQFALDNQGSVERISLPPQYRRWFELSDEGS